MSEVNVIRKCSWCGKHYTLKVDRDKVERWQNGELIQNVWPDSSPAWREMMISGTHPKCWEEMWREDDGA